MVLTLLKDKRAMMALNAHLSEGPQLCDKALIQMLQFKHILTQWIFHRHTSHDQHSSTYKKRSRSVGQGGMQ